MSRVSPQPSLCHPDKPRVTKDGQCMSCYDKARPRNTDPEAVQLRREYYRNWYNGRSIELNRLYKIKSYYGLSPEAYLGLLESQGGRCAICGVTESSGGRVLCVDHNHATSRVRGLLCDACNVGIGKLQDDPALLRKAAEYLEGTS